MIKLSVKSIRTTLLVWTLGIALLPSLFVATYLIKQFQEIQFDEQKQKLTLHAEHATEKMAFELRLLTDQLKQNALDTDILLAAYSGVFGQKARVKLDSLLARHSLLNTVMLIDQEGWIAEAAPRSAELINLSAYNIFQDFQQNNDTAVPNLTARILNNGALVDEIYAKGRHLNNMDLRSSSALIFVIPLVFSDANESNFATTHTGYLVAYTLIDNLHYYWQEQLDNSHLRQLSFNNSPLIATSLNVDKQMVKAHVELPLLTNTADLKISALVDRDRTLAMQPVLDIVANFKVITLTIICLILIISFVVVRQLLKPLDVLDKVVTQYAKGNQPPDNIDLFFTEFNQILQVLAQMAERIQIEQQELEHRVDTRTEELQDAFDELYSTNEQLKNMQTQLVEAEKMSQLGQLVAGVAHEINTPVGIAVTAATSLIERMDQLETQFDAGALTKNGMRKYMQISRECSDLIYNNLTRAADLIQNFKEVAVDQTNENRRSFNLYNYINEICGSLQPKIKTYQVDVTIKGDEDLILDNYPGAFAQIFTNFIVNSLHHGFEQNQSHSINIDFTLENNGKQLKIIYQDDGGGIPAAHLTKVFDPFYTTKRGQGGSGLGLNIVYNLITQRLKGTIECASEPTQGTRFIILLPVNLFTVNE
ncbi:sensor histidine kinase [Algibacillus agarilyticus]|uniref:sensor histidine kinase n=1 Tax=Algibacillus agarilyticus TaxID=2234133 RepID=UPI000DD0287A|nr:HAMP domain-containing sensor histidine kinase [Algibacillus agarilyticus]